MSEDELTPEETSEYIKGLFIESIEETLRRVLPELLDKALERHEQKRRLHDSISQRT